MRHWVAAGLVAGLVGCGRVGFDAAGGDAARFDAAGGDAPPPGPDAGPAGPVAWWRFDNPPLQEALDATGNGHDGDCDLAGGECASRVDDGQYQFAFDGLDDHYVVADAPALRPPQWTVTAWVRPRLVVNGAVLSRPVGAGVGNSLQLELASDGRVGFTVGTATSNDTLWTPGAVLAAGVYVHLALRFDGATRDGFVDGELVVTGPATIGYDVGPLVLGADLDGAPPTLLLPLDGQLRDVRFYDRELTDDEVRALATPP